MQRTTAVSAEGSVVSRFSVLVQARLPMDVKQEVVRAYESLRSLLRQYLAAVLGDSSEVGVFCAGNVSAAFCSLIWPWDDGP